MTIGCEAPGLMPIADAIQIISQTIEPVDECELCHISHGLDRILASDIISPINVPAHTNSAMDGYAFRHSDIASTPTLALVGDSFAGSPFSGTLAQGQCVRIMTGAEIPDGADSVVMQENTQAHNNTITITAPVRLGEAIRKAGNDIAKDSIVLFKGKRLNAIDIGLIASLGIAEISVFRKIKVAVFSTGDELLHAGAQHSKGRIFDSNGPMLVAMLQRLGAEVIDLGIIADDREKITDAFKYADQHADCVITSGGVSVGEADYTREILESIGDVAFWKLAIKPGKPLAFGRLANSVFFGLPGNPVSSAVTFDQIVVPALSLLSGGVVIEPIRISAKAKQRFKKRPGRTDYQRAFCSYDASGELWVQACGSQSSGVLSSFTQSNCYAILEQERGSVDVGENVTIQLFDGVLR